MSLGIKFNDANGDSDQKYCENTCPFRWDTADPPARFDVYYKLIQDPPEGGQNWYCTQGRKECMVCEHINNHVNG